MVLKIHLSEILAVVGTGPVNVETQVFRQQLVHRFILHHVDGAHVDAQELRGDFGVLVGEFAVGDDDDGKAAIAVMRRAGHFPAALFAHVGEGRPQGHDVADAVFECGERGRLVHILDGHVLFGQAKGLEPRAQGEVGRGNGRAEDGFTLHAFGGAVYVRVALVIALGLHDRAVGADHDGVDHRLVVAVGNDVGVVAQGAHEGGNRSHAAEDPCLGGQGAEGVHAGAEVEQLDIEAHFLVPSLLLGIPDGEGFLSAHPRGGDFLEFGGACRAHIGHAEDGSAEAAKPFFDVHMHYSPVLWEEGEAESGVESSGESSTPQH